MVRYQEVQEGLVEHYLVEQEEHFLEEEVAHLVLEEGQMREEVVEDLEVLEVQMISEVEEVEVDRPHQQGEEEVVDLHLEEAVAEAVVVDQAY